jgi:hypothetical protein
MNANLFIHAINLPQAYRFGSIGVCLLRMYEYTICIVKWEDFLFGLTEEMSKTITRLLKSIK